MLYKGDVVDWESQPCWASSCCWLGFGGGAERVLRTAISLWKGGGMHVNSHSQHPQLAHLGCSMGTSSTRSGGISKSSGSRPSACRTRGNTSKRPYLGFQPRSMHSWGQDRPSEPGDPGPWASLGSALTRQSWVWYLCELHAGGVPSDAAIRHLVAGIADELGVPDPEVMLPIAPLGEHSDGRPFPRRGWYCLPPGFGGGFQPPPS